MYAITWHLTNADGFGEYGTFAGYKEDSGITPVYQSFKDAKSIEANNILNEVKSLKKDGDKFYFEEFYFKSRDSYKRASELIIGFNEFKPSISTEEINILFKSKDRFDFYDYLIKKVDATKDRKDWYNHISWWNYNRLEKILKEIGFSSIYKSAYSQSKFVILRDIKHFDQTAPWYSVYVDAIK